MMRTLENRVARLEAIRGDSDKDFMVVFITKFSSDAPPSARIGGNDDLPLEQAPGETFEIFEARAVATAKGAGKRFVAIEVQARFCAPG
jgi:hypothetical protein